MPRGPYPVVLCSPGAGDPRSMGTTLYDDLASRGYDRPSHRCPEARFFSG
ncbi:hypothetical protein ACIO6U_27440 [Streptomyces sp. NPDC087422]